MKRIVNWMIRNRLLRFMFIVPLLTTLVFGMIFFEMLDEAEQAVLDSTKNEKRLNVDAAALKMDMFIIADDDWDTEYDYYITSITYSMEILDIQPRTFAAAYDSQLKLISGVYEQAGESSLDPLGYAEFLEAVDANESGELMLPMRAYDGDIPSDRDENWYLYYRWIPTDTELEGRFLAVVGIIDTAVTAGIAESLSAWMSVILVLTGFVNILMVVVISRFASITHARGVSHG